MNNKRPSSIKPLSILAASLFLSVWVAFSAVKPAHAKNDIDCTTLITSSTKRGDPTFIKAKVHGEISPLTIQPKGDPILYWQPLELRPEKPEFCVKLPLRAPSMYPVLLGGSVYKPKENGMIVLPVEWLEESTTLLLTQIDDEGELHPTKIVLKGPSPSQLLDQFYPKPTVSTPGEDRYLAWSANAGLQPSYLHYDQTRLSTPYTASVITLKAGGNLSLDAKENWTLDGSAYFTLLHLAQSRDDSPRYLGGNLRLTRKLGQWEKGPGTPVFRLGVGPYYLTTFIPTQAFSFANLGGIQLLPTARFELPNWGFLGAYIKFATVNEGFIPKGLANREVAFGLNWSPMRGWTTPWSVSLDLSNLYTQIQDEQVLLNTYNLGISYRFK
jgi:hypothetical protein